MPLFFIILGATAIIVALIIRSTKKEPAQSGPLTAKVEVRISEPEIRQGITQVVLRAYVNGELVGIDIITGRTQTGFIYGVGQHWETRAETLTDAIEGSKMYLTHDTRTNFRIFSENRPDAGDPKAEKD